MKHLLVVCAMLVAASAHASVVGASHGNHGAAGFGPAGGQAAAGQASRAATSNAGTAGQSGNGGSYSVVDNYQPWDEASMRQFEKPHWVVWDGK